MLACESWHNKTLGHWKKHGCRIVGKISSVCFHSLGKCVSFAVMFTESILCDSWVFGLKPVTTHFWVSFIYRVTQKRAIGNPLEHKVNNLKMRLKILKKQAKLAKNACNLGPNIAWKCYLGPFRHRNAARWAPRRSPSLGGPRPLGPFGRKMSLQGRIMAPIWGLKWLPKRAFEVRLALGPSKNECLGLVFEKIRIFMIFQCEAA